MAGEIITSDDILGKEALDPEGEFIGIVMKLHIHRENKELVGITIDQGFMKPDLFVGLESIERFGIDALFINRITLKKYVGKSVITTDGRIIGEVINITEHKGRLEKIEIVGTDKKKIEIPTSQIASLGTTVLLKEDY